MERLRRLFHKLVNRETILYVVFGVCTTLINIAVFALCNKTLRLSWELSNAAAWLLAVLFAFFTNKLFVFQSRGSTAKRFLWEILSFFAARLLSLGMEYAGMWLLIDVLRVEEVVSKVLMNVVVILVNYVLSKLIIFKRP